ncbi:MAG: hypothetical protein WCE63_04030 [Acidobacteriaceae bacterium]
MTLMIGAAERYCKEVHDQLKMYSPWLPDVRLEPGDFGKVSNAIFTKEGNLGKNFKINFTTKQDSDADASYEFSSKGCKQIDVNSSATGLPGGVASAAMKVTFQNANSVFFNLQNCTGQAIDDLYELGKTLLDLTEAGKFDLGYFVVTRVVDAGAATIIQSNDRGADIDLQAAANYPTIQDAFKVAGGVSASAKSSIGFSCIAKNKMRPLIRLGKVSYSFWKDAFTGIGNTWEPTALTVRSVGRSARLDFKPFVQAARRTANVELATGRARATADSVLRIHMPQSGAYANVGPVLDLLDNARGSSSKSRVGRQTRVANFTLDHLRTAVGSTVGVEFGKSSEAFPGHIALDVRIPRLGEEADIRHVHSLLTNLLRERQSRSREVKATLSFSEID